MHNQNITFTLKNVKVCEWASEETTCFTATLYMNGKRLGNVRNDGHGGCNFYDFPMGEILDLSRDYEWNQWVSMFGDKAGNKEDFRPSFDGVIDELLTQHELVSQVKKFRNKLAKTYPTKANDLRIYIDGDQLCAAFSGTKQDEELAAKAGLAPSEIAVSI